MEHVEVAALQPLTLPAGHVEKGEHIVTTESHAQELESLGLVKRPAKKAAAKADKSDKSD